MGRPDSATSRAFLFGSSTFDDPELPPLPAVANNLRDLTAILTSPDGTGLPAPNVTTLANETQVGSFGHQLELVARQAQDLLLVYYAGHGLLDPKGELYLTLPGTRGDHLRWTGLPFRLIQEVILDSPARSKVLILDCCFSGRAIEAMSSATSVVSGQIEIAGTYTLTSVPANRTAHAPVGARYTAFTGLLLDILRNGTDKPVPFLTMHDIYEGLRHHAAARGLPKPEQRNTQTVGGLALVPNHQYASLDPLADAMRAVREASERVDATLAATRQGWSEHPEVTEQQVAGEESAQQVAQVGMSASPAWERAEPRRQGTDALLDQLRAEIAAGQLTSQDVRDVAFASSSYFRRGYHEQEVDAFLDRVEAELDTPVEGRHQLTADDVRTVEFSRPPIGGKGYDEAEVDDFLDRVEAELARREDLVGRYLAALEGPDGIR